jgi:hypothetical protein
MINFDYLASIKIEILVANNKSNYLKKKLVGLTHTIF